MIQLNKNMHNSAQVMQAGAKWTRNSTPEGVLQQAIKGVDDSNAARFSTAFVENLDDLSEKISKISAKDIPDDVKRKEIAEAFKEFRGKGITKRIKGEKEIAEAVLNGKIGITEAKEILSSATNVPMLKVEDQKEIFELAKKMLGKDADDKEVKKAIEQINAILSKNTNWSKRQKTVEIAHIMMLMNWRTMGRNMGANIAFMPLEKSSEKVAALGEYAYMIKNPDYKRTRSFFVSNKSRKLAKEYSKIHIDDVEKGITSKFNMNQVSGKIGPDQMFTLNNDPNILVNRIKKAIGLDINKNTVSQIPVLKQMSSGAKKGLDKFAELSGAEGAFDALSSNKTVAENIRQLTYGLLDLGDKPFVKSHFESRLASYIQANKIKNLEDIPEEAFEMARATALKATFKDDNALTKLFSDIKRLPIVGETTIPFVKTPANVTMRIADYSPIGLVSGTMKGIKKDSSVEKICGDLARGIVGSTGILGGIWLGQSGVLQGELSKNSNVKAFQQSIGMLKNSISTKGVADFIEKYTGLDWHDKLGDDYLTYDWAEPAAVSWSIGLAISDAIDEGDVFSVDTAKKNWSDFYQFDN